MGFRQRVLPDPPLLLDIEHRTDAIRNSHEIGGRADVAPAAGALDLADFTYIGDPQFHGRFDAMQSAAPEALVDDEAGWFGDKVRPGSEQQLVRDDPDIWPRLALPLISADIVKFADGFLVLARPPRHFTKGGRNQRHAVEFAAHFLARLLWVGRLSATVDTSSNARFGKIAHDLVTEPVPRHG